MLNLNCNFRENQDTLGKLCEIGTTSWNSEKPTNPKDNPIHFTVNSIPQKILTMSADNAYGTVDKDSQQIVLIQDNPAYFSTTTNDQLQVPLSSNPAYGTLCVDSQEPAIQDVQTHLPAHASNRSVA